MSSRTYGWADPRQTAEASQTMAGIDFLRAMMNGQLAQCAYQQTMDYDLVEVGDGRVVFAGKAAEYMLNPLGSVHGG